MSEVNRSALAVVQGEPQWLMEAVRCKISVCVQDLHKVGTERDETWPDPPAEFPEPGRTWRTSNEVLPKSKADSACVNAPTGTPMVSTLSLTDEVAEAALRDAKEVGTIAKWWFLVKAAGKAEMAAECGLSRKHCACGAG